MEQKRNISKEYQFITDIHNTAELIKVLPTLHIDVQRHFYKFSSKAKEVVRLSIYAKQGSLGEITKEPFFLSLLEKESMVEFRKALNAFMDQNASIELSNNLIEYYENILKTYNEELGIFQYQEEVLRQLEVYDARTIKTNLIVPRMDLIKINAMNKEERIAYLKIKASILISNVIIDALFEDNYYNVLKNLKEMLSYQLITLEKKHIEFYQQVLEIDSMSNQEKITFYHKYKKQNIKEKCYDDLRKLKDHMLTNIKNNLYQLQKQQKSYCPILSKLLGVDIYNIRNVPYYLLVRSLNDPFLENVKGIRRACYTLISNEKNSCFQPEYHYQYGYNDFDIQDIAHVFERDSFSEGYSQNNDKTGTNCVNRLIKIEDLLFKSEGINEIQILNKKGEDIDYKPLKPSMLLVYHLITKRKLLEAKRLNIPLVLVKKSNKQKAYNYEDITLNDIYISNVYEENEELKNRLEKICKKKKTRL